MAEVFHRSLFLPGPAGRLEAMLWTVASANPDFVALVCHPHPLFGGTMHNKVVFQAAKALHRRGIPVLRFNFRAKVKASTTKAAANETMFARASIFFPPNFPDARFCWRVSVSVHGSDLPSAVRMSAFWT
jgi:hypothetical protein